MLFSIIIPTYNRANFIKSTVYSILMQTYANFEIIIVDDGSTDNTREVIEEIKDHRIHYYLKANEERAIARNFGTSKAKGDYITFLDSDDFLMPNMLNEALKECRKTGQPEWFHIRYKITDENDVTIAEKEIYKKNTDPNKRLFYEGNFLSCIGVFLRKDIALQNQFNTDRRLILSEDHELWLRLAVKYPLHINDVVCAKLIQHNTRSVLHVDFESLVLCKEVSMQLVFQNEETNNYIKGHEGKFISSAYSYLSLHLALSGKYKKQCVVYALKSVKYNFSYLFTRRFIATVKNLLFTYHTCAA